jgi:anti-anti-sigma factor
MTTRGIQQRTIDEKTVLIVPGPKLDNENAAEMSSAIGAAQLEGYLDIRIDMSGLQMLSSAGVGAILGSVEISRQQGGDITLWNPSAKVRNVLEILDLGEYLSIKNGEAAGPKT